MSFHRQASGLTCEQQAHCALRPGTSFSGRGPRGQGEEEGSQANAILLTGATPSTSGRHTSRLALRAVPLPHLAFSQAAFDID